MGHLEGDPWHSIHMHAAHCPPLDPLRMKAPLALAVGRAPWIYLSSIWCGWHAPGKPRVPVSAGLTLTLRSMVKNHHLHACGGQRVTSKFGVKWEPHPRRRGRGPESSQASPGFTPQHHVRTSHQITPQRYLPPYCHLVSLHCGQGAIQAVWLLRLTMRIGMIPQSSNPT